MSLKLAHCVVVVFIAVFAQLHDVLGLPPVLLNSLQVVEGNQKQFFLRDEHAHGRVIP